MKKEIKEEEEAEIEKPITDKELHEISNGDGLMKFTVKTLKELCLNRNIKCKSSSSKRMLIAALQKFIRNKML